MTDIVHPPRATISFASELYYTGARLNWHRGSRPGVPFEPLVQARILAPATASNTGIVNAQAVAGAGNVATLAGTTPGTLSTEAASGHGRTLRYASSGAGDTSQVVIVTGLDQYSQPQTEKVTLNGTTPVLGTKGFATIVSVNVSAAMAGNLSVGTQAIFTLPYCLAGKYDMLAAWVDASAEEKTTGTLVVADTTNPATNVTGDTRGTWSPATAPNGARNYYLWYRLPKPSGTAVETQRLQTRRIYGVTPV